MPNKPEHGSGGKRKIQQIDQSPDSKKLKQCLITSFLAASSSQSTAAGAKASQEKQSFSTKSDVLDAKNSPTRQATFANNKASPTGSDSVELVKKLNAKPPEWSAENTDLNQSAEDSNTIQFVTSFKPIITKPLQHAGEEAVIVEVVGGKTSSSPDVSQTQKHRSVKKKHLRVVESSDEDEEDEEESKAKKSLRCLAEDDEDAEYKPDAAKSSSSESEPEAAEVASEAESTASADENLADDDIIDDEEDADDKHKANQKRSRQAKPKASAKPSKAQQGTPNRSNKTAFSHAKFLATAAENEFATADDAAADSTTVHEHESYKFIKPESIRDKNLRRPEHPDYDPKTLFVDQEFLKNQTPAMKQWWQIKADNMDCILFFKMGKFYELWHQDADVGVKHLNLIHMRGEKAHAGFPEQAFSTKEQALVRAGFKVIRVEQTETPDELKQRQQDKKGGGDTSKQRKKPAPDELADPSKCVRRQICQISTPGTRMPSVLDYAVSSFTTEGYKKGAGLGTDGASEEASEITFPLTDDLLLVVLEQRSAAIPVASGGGMHHFMYGVTMFNSTRGQVIIGQFEDDKHRSRLRTLLAAHTPVEILYERNCLHADTLAVINAMLPSARVEALLSNRDVPSAETTLKLIHEKKYFEEAIEPPLSKHWPAELVACVDAEDRAARSPNRAKELCLRSFGAFVKYLDKCCVDRDILPLKNFSEYIPADVGRAAEQEKNNVAPVKQQQQMLRGKMVIDGITLRNLDILMNGSTGSAEKGSLLVQLDSCRTFFGRRKLREMLCAPPIDINIITQTQRDMQALERLQQARPESIREILDLLKKMPDIERLLVRVFQMGSKFRAFEHAEAQANFFDMDRYSKRKILDFIGTINGLEKCAQIVGILQKKHSSPTSSTNGQQFSSSFEQMLCFDELRAIEQELFEFKQSFNMKEALERGNIRPSKGADADYEDAVTHMSKLERKFNEYLAEQQKFFGTTEIKYWGRDRNRFQLEIPERYCSKVSNEYELKSQRKGAKRYWTNKTREFVQFMIKAEDRLNEALTDVARRIYERFSKKFVMWKRLADGIGQLDAMLSLLNSARAYRDTCWPEFVVCDGETVQRPFITIVNGRHPIIFETYSRDEYIPNDVDFGGGDKAPLILVTGPNMGGKSTFMRQNGLIALMAHLGCRVPATSCRLTPIDRIFTRIGASDNLVANESTFYVELSETSTILRHATQHSLVLIDELGRGTATHDGTAIAMSVVHHLAERIRCRTLFSTHYHLLVKEFSGLTDLVQLGHMACMVENETVDQDDPTQENITFLYKFAAGACPKSYGFHVAKLAGLRPPIIKKAYDEARKLEAFYLLTEMTLRACQLQSRLSLPTASETDEREVRVKDLMKLLHSLVVI